MIRIFRALILKIKKDIDEIKYLNVSFSKG